MRALRKASKGKSCIRCGCEDGTICLRHYNGYRSHALGKGRGIKPHDLAGADLCNSCDSIFSESNYDLWPDGSKSISRSETFLFLCLKTAIRRFEEGILMVEGKANTGSFKKKPARKESPAYSLPSKVIKRDPNNFQI